MSWAIIPTTIQAAYHFPKFLANEQNQMILYTTIVTMVIQMLTKNALNAQNMIKEVIKTYKNFSAEKDPANDCLDTAIITDPKSRTKKTMKKLQYIAGRAFNKKQ